MKVPNYFRVVRYTVLALNQTIETKLDPKNHVNVLDSLLSQLKKRPGLVLLKRLTIVLDEESEKGFGLVRVEFRALMSLC